MGLIVPECNAAIQYSYDRDSAQPVRHVQDDKHNGSDGSISM